MLHPVDALQTRWIGAVIFCLSYAVFAFGRVPGTKIDRTAIAAMGAALMVLLGVLTPAHALAAVDFPTLLLLLGMMLLGAALDEAGFFAWVTEHLVQWCGERAAGGPRLLLGAVIFSGGILSALLVNDVVCVVCTPLVLELAHRLRLRPLPYLLALATASNIGSVATIVGNPQNILIASVSHIGYLAFARRLAPVALLGLLADWAILAAIFRRGVREPAAELESNASLKVAGEEPPLRRMFWPLTIGLLVLVALTAGVNPGAAAVGAVCLLMIRRQVAPAALFKRIDFALLIFFIGLFVVLAGGQAAGLNERLLAAAEHLNLRDSLTLTAVVALLTNLVSNVPAVMLLKPVLPMTQQQGNLGWLLLAMASTLAGNLTITGSIANIIVVETAREEAPVSFWQYLRVGMPVTLVTLAIGWVWLRFFGA